MDTGRSYLIINVENFARKNKLKTAEPEPQDLERPRNFEMVMICLMGEKVMEVTSN